MPNAYTFAAAIANQFPKGIQNVYVQKTSGDTGFSSLGQIKNGSVTFDMSVSTATAKVENPFAGILKVEFDMMQCTATELHLLDTLCGGAVYALIKTVKGDFVALTSATTLPGITAKVDASGNVTKDRFIHITMQVGILPADIVNVFPAATPTVTAPVTGDTFWPIGNTGILVTNLGRPENIKPAGLLKVELQGAFEAGGAALQDLGRVKNVSLIAEFVADTELDEFARPNVYGVDIKFSADMQQSSQAASQEIAQLAAMFTSGAQFKLTHHDGMIWTISVSGIRANPTNTGNFEGLRVIKLFGGGRITTGAFDAAIS